MAFIKDKTPMEYADECFMTKIDGKPALVTPSEKTLTAAVCDLFNHGQKELGITLMNDLELFFVIDSNAHEVLLAKGSKSDTLAA